MPQIRLGSKVSALIINTAQDEDSSWPTLLDYTLALLSLTEKAPKKKAASEKAAAKVTSESSSSSSEGSESQPRPTTTKPTSTQPIQTPQLTPSHSSTPSTPKTSKWKAIPRPSENGSSASLSSRTTSHTPLPSEADLTSAPASSLPTEVELTSASASEPTEIGLTPVSASANLPPHKDLSPVLKEVEMEEEVAEEEEREEEEATSDCQVTGGADSHEILFQSVQYEKDSLSQRAEEYIEDHFHALHNFSDVYEQVKQLVLLVMLKTSHWGYIRERVSVDTWGRLINQEEEVLSTFDIRSLWLTSQALEAQIAHFCRINGVPIEGDDRADARQPSPDAEMEATSPPHVAAED